VFGGGRCRANQTGGRRIGGGSDSRNSEPSAQVDTVPLGYAGFFGTQAGL